MDDGRLGRRKGLGGNHRREIALLALFAGGARRARFALTQRLQRFRLLFRHGLSFRLLLTDFRLGLGLRRGRLDLRFGLGLSWGGLRGFRLAHGLRRFRLGGSGLGGCGLRRGQLGGGLLFLIAQAEAAQQIAQAVVVLALVVHHGQTHAGGLAAEQAEQALRALLKHIDVNVGNGDAQLSQTVVDGLLRRFAGKFLDSHQMPTSSALAALRSCCSKYLLKQICSTMA